MKIQPVIVTTGTTKKGNSYKKSNAGKFFAFAELDAVATTIGLIALAEKKAYNVKFNPAIKQTLSSAFKSAKTGVMNFFKHPVQLVRNSVKNINKQSIKETGSNLLKKANSLSPAAKAVILSAALILAANLGFDFIYNKISAHRADKNA